MKILFSICALALALAVGATVVSAGAASAAPRKKPVAGCEAAAAIKLIGQAAPDDAKVRKLTGARTVRRVKPGQSVTLDYRPERVTLEIAAGRIVSTSCG